MTVSPSDTLVGPIVAQLALVAQQIDGMGTTYQKVPEQAPEDNSVMFPCKHVDVVSSTNGRLTLHLTFDIVHVFRRTRLQEVLDRCYAALPAWLTVLGDRKNVTLGGTAQLMDVTAADIKEVKHANQQFLGVVTTIIVRYEFRIP